MGKSKAAYRETEDWIDRIADTGVFHPGELEDAYEAHYITANDYIDYLEARLKFITDRFERYCREGLELGGMIHPLNAPEAQRTSFDLLYQAIKGIKTEEGES